MHQSSSSMMDSEVTGRWCPSPFPVLWLSSLEWWQKWTRSRSLQLSCITLGEIYLCPEKKVELSWSPWIWDGLHIGPWNIVPTLTKWKHMQNLAGQLLMFGLDSSFHPLPVGKFAWLPPVAFHELLVSSCIILYPFLLFFTFWTSASKISSDVRKWHFRSLYTIIYIYSVFFVTFCDWNGSSKRTSAASPEHTSLRVSGNGLRQQVLRPHQIVDVEDPLALARCISVWHRLA